MTALRLRVWESFAAALRSQPARAMNTRAFTRVSIMAPRSCPTPADIAGGPRSWRSLPHAAERLPGSQAPSVADHRFERGSELLALIGPRRYDPQRIGYDAVRPAQHAHADPVAAHDLEIGRAHV